MHKLDLLMVAIIKLALFLILTFPKNFLQNTTFSRKCRFSLSLVMHFLARILNNLYSYIYTYMDLKKVKKCIKITPLNGWNN